MPQTQPILTLGDEPVVFDHDGDVLIAYCFNLTFYSVDMSTPEQKRAVLQIFDEYTAVYASKVTWTTNPKSGAWKKLKGNISSYITPHDWLMAAPQDEGYSFLYHGGKTGADYSDICLMAKAVADYRVRDRDMSTLNCRFPLKDVLDGLVDLPALMHHWGTLLKPHHARGGLFAGRWFDAFGKRALIFGVLADALMRYPGLQYSRSAEGLYNEKSQSGLYDGPCCADWLIALSDPFVEKLGGIKAVAEKMRPYPVFAYEGGAVLQAGEMAGLGSDGDPATLPAYMHLGKVIEPVRAKNLAFMLYIPDATASSGFSYAPELSEKWCTRFSGFGNSSINK
jgi:hypothetical protein